MALPGAHSFSQFQPVRIGFMHPFVLSTSTGGSGRPFTATRPHSELLILQLAVIYTSTFQALQMIINVWRGHRDILDASGLLCAERNVVKLFLVVLRVVLYTALHMSAHQIDCSI